MEKYITIPEAHFKVIEERANLYQENTITIELAERNYTWYGYSHIHYYEAAFQDYGIKKHLSIKEAISEIHEHISKNDELLEKAKEVLKVAKEKNEETKRLVSAANDVIIDNNYRLRGWVMKLFGIVTIKEIQIPE